MNCRKVLIRERRELILCVSYFSLLLIVLSMGCASFRGNQLPKAEPILVDVVEKPTVSIDVQFQATLNGNPVKFGNKLATKTIKKEAIKEFRRSGVFSNVGEQVANADLKVKLDMTDVGEANIGMAVLTGLTLYIIPSKATDTYVLVATVRDSSDKEIAQYDLTDSVTQWQEILLLPIMPFKMTPVVATGVRKNMFRTLIHKMIDDGVVK